MSDFASQLAKAFEGIGVGIGPGGHIDQGGFPDGDMEMEVCIASWVLDVFREGRGNEVRAVRGQDRIGSECFGELFEESPFQGGQFRDAFENQFDVGWFASAFEQRREFEEFEVRFDLGLGAFGPIAFVAKGTEVLKDPVFGGNQGSGVGVAQQDLQAVREHLAGDLSTGPACADDRDGFTMRGRGVDRRVRGG